MQPECPGTLIIELSNVNREILAFPATLVGFSSPSFSGLVFGHDLWVVDRWYALSVKYIPTLLPTKFGM